MKRQVGTAIGLIRMDIGIGLRSAEVMQIFCVQRMARVQISASLWSLQK